MSREALVELLRVRLGLDPTVLGERVLDDAFAEARRALGVSGDAALHARAVADPSGFADVVEHFVVPETWFFRAPEQFADLVRFARAQRARPRIRVLSLPCASGEEAYSAAMALLDAGFSPDQFEVLGIDVSRRAVEHAAAGHYRRNAIRGDPTQSPWLSPQHNGFAIDPLVKRCVRFRQGNALDTSLFEPGERFDVVFCRNLLIYLHEEARAKLLAMLCAAMTTPALVLAGQAEVLPAMARGFAPMAGANSPLTYLYNGADSVRDTRLDAAARVVAVPVEKPVPAPKPARERKVDKAPEPPPRTPLEEARRLADLGQLDAARAQLGVHLDRAREDVDALYLLGLIESARGDIGAADAAFARVLYLDGHHADALDHRIALAQRLGDTVAVNQLRARARRMRSKAKS